MQKIIIVVLLIIAIFLFLQNKSEHAGSVDSIQKISDPRLAESTSPNGLTNEAIQNIASIYAKPGLANFNNINVTGQTSTSTLNVGKDESGNALVNIYNDGVIKTKSFIFGNIVSANEYVGSNESGNPPFSVDKLGNIKANSISLKNNLRYVQICYVPAAGDGTYWNVGGIEVLDNTGKNIAVAPTEAEVKAGVKLPAVSIVPGSNGAFPFKDKTFQFGINYEIDPSFMIDPFKIQRYKNQSPSPLNAGNARSYIEIVTKSVSKHIYQIDLGNLYDISSIKLYAWYPYANRANNTQIRLFKDDPSQPNAVPVYILNTGLWIKNQTEYKVMFVKPPPITLEF